MVERLKTVPDGGSAGPEELSQETVTEFAAQYTQFNATLKKLRASYSDLSDRYGSLQHELECVNVKLRDALTEKASAAAYLQSILRSISSGVISVDLQGRIQHFNPGAERIFGLRESQVLGLPYRDVLPADPPSADSALRGPRANVEGEKLFINARGTALPLSVSTAILTDDSGKVRGAVEIVTDLSRIRALETEMMRVKTLAAIGEMSATVAHEIRNPLGGIAGFAGLLAAEFESGHPSRTYADNIVKGCENLNRIVTNLLRYAEPLKLELRSCDIKAELLEEVALFEQNLKSTSDPPRIEMHICVEDVRGMVDPVQLRIALHNLLLNGEHATGPGTIKCGLEVEENKSGSGVINIWVEDDGPGIPDAHLDSVFTPFFTTKDKGSGLGLATVMKVVDAHRGSIKLTRPAKGGARFELRIPMG